jgi:hypothetical protein
VFYLGAISTTIRTQIEMALLQGWSPVIIFRNVPGQIGMWPCNGPAWMAFSHAIDGKRQLESGNPALTALYLGI